MTLKTIPGYRNTNEAAAVVQQIEFRANGAALFGHDPAAPKVSAPAAPSV
jgi:hypothetical protein